MALGGLIPRRPRVGPVFFQCAVRESYDLQATVTDNPVAFGAVVTDHVQVQPQTLVLEVMASTDLGIGLGPYQGPGASVRTWQALEALYRTRLLVDVVTGFGSFRGYVITSLRTVRNAEMSGGVFGALIIEITLRQVVIALVDEVENVADAAADLALGASDVGAQGTQALPTPAF